jgi:hypothetical protein
MCSHPTEEQLARLTAAIDELAAAGPDGLPPEAWAERVAEIWALVESLDPEIARRRSYYTG